MAAQPLWPAESPLTGPRELLPKGSEQYARTTVELLRLYWASVRSDEERVRHVLDELEAARVYERWPEAQPYGNLDALCLAELGVSLPVVRRTISEAAVERAEREGAGGKRGESGRHHVNTDYIRNESHGTDPTYLARRLKRADPDRYERLKAGGYRSVRAAALNAGIVKTTVQAPRTVDGIVRAIRRHFTPEQINAIVDALAGVGVEPG